MGSQARVAKHPEYPPEPQGSCTVVLEVPDFIHRTKSALEAMRVDQRGEQRPMAVSHGTGA